MSESAREAQSRPNSGEKSFSLTTTTGAVLGLLGALYFALPAFILRGMTELDHHVLKLPRVIQRAVYAPIVFLEQTSPQYRRFADAQLSWSYSIIPGGIYIF